MVSHGDTGITLYDNATNYMQIHSPSAYGQPNYRLVMPLKQGTTNQVWSIASVSGNVIQSTFTTINGMTAGSTFYIQNTLTPTTTTQKANLLLLTVKSTTTFGDGINPAVITYAAGTPGDFLEFYSPQYAQFAIMTDSAPGGTANLTIQDGPDFGHYRNHQMEIGVDINYDGSLGIEDYPAPGHPTIFEILGSAGVSGRTSVGMLDTDGAYDVLNVRQGIEVRGLAGDTDNVHFTLRTDAWQLPYESLEHRIIGPNGLFYAWGAGGGTNTSDPFYDGGDFYLYNDTFGNFALIIDSTTNNVIFGIGNNFAKTGAKVYIGTTTSSWGTNAFEVHNQGSNTDIAVFMNESTDGYSDNGFFDNTGLDKMWIGHGNPGTVDPWKNANYIQSINTPLVLLSGVGGSQYSLTISTDGKVIVGSSTSTISTALLSVRGTIATTSLANTVIAADASGVFVSTTIPVTSPGGTNKNVQISSGGVFAGVSDFNVWASSIVISAHSLSVSTLTVTSSSTFSTSTFTGQVYGPTGTTTNPTFSSLGNANTGLLLNGVTLSLVSGSGTFYQQTNASAGFGNNPLYIGDYPGVSPAVAIWKNGQNSLEINNGTSGTRRDLSVRSIGSSGTITVQVSTTSTYGLTVSTDGATYMFSVSTISFRTVIGNGGTNAAGFGGIDMPYGVGHGLKWSSNGAAEILVPLGSNELDFYTSVKSLALNATTSEFGDTNPATASWLLGIQGSGGNTNRAGMPLTIYSGVGSGNASSGYMAFQVGGSANASGTTAATLVEAMRIQPITANVSIGTSTNVGARLEVISSANSAFTAYFSTTATGGYGVDISTIGHFNVFNSSQTSGPTITNGNANLDSACSDTACKVTATASPCTFTFSKAYTKTPVCTVTLESSSVAWSHTVTTTAVTVTQVGLSTNINIICVGRD